MRPKLARVASKVRKNPVRGYGAPVQLAQEVPAGSGPVWIQVATEGKWEGHPSGRVVDFTRARLNQIIANFHAHPWYEAGEDGVGQKRVVPYDYEHASELLPTEGSVPTAGVPAPAWALELQLRNGEDGTAELWAYTELSDQVREQIRNGGYASTSVAVWPNHKDPVSGKPIGAVLTSIAFTNKPFIQGMAPIAASVSVYGQAESPEEAIVGMRDLLGLPADAAREVVTTELEALRQAAAEGRTPPAYPEGLHYLFDAIRRLLGLRVLATTDEILNSAGQVVGAAANPPATAATPQTPETPMTQSASTPDTLAKLADLLNCRDSEPMLLAAVEKVKAKGDTLDQLLGLFESDDMTSLLADAAKTIEKAKKADEYMAGLTAVRERLGAADKKEAEVEAEQIAASMGLTGDTAAKMKPLLMSARLACNVDDQKVAAEKLAAFRAQYPLPTNSADRTLLTSSLVAGAGGVQLMAAPAGAPPAGGGGGGRPPVPPHVLLFAAYPGRNDIEKAMAYHTEKTPGFSQNPRQTQVRAASEFIRTGQLAL